MHFFCPNYPASIQDFMIYRDLRIVSNAGLRQMINEIFPKEGFFIQAAWGYKGKGLPEKYLTSIRSI